MGCQLPTTTCCIIGKRIQQMDRHLANLLITSSARNAFPPASSHIIHLTIPSLLQNLLQSPTSERIICDPNEPHELCFARSGRVASRKCFIPLGSLQCPLSSTMHVIQIRTSETKELRILCCVLALEICHQNDELMSARRVVLPCA